MRNVKTLLILTMLTLISCSGSATASDSQAGESATSEVAGKAFNADSAFAYVRAQTEFGPRVPGSQAHAQCAEYLAAMLARFGADTVDVQQGVVTAYNGDKLPIRNIFARFNPQAPSHVLLLSHWDSRPWADNDDNPEARRKPIDGANDGASGVGVLLEIARNIGANKPDVGVDILFVDAEDYGRHADDPRPADAPDHDDSWALGTQYWAASKPYADAKLPEYAILLDMVGGTGAKFYQEMFSRQYAPAVVDRIWSRAAKIGFADRFPRPVGGAVTDDHIYINRMGIPAIDIIEIAHPLTGSFNPTWHTVNDNINNISPETLGVVGTLVLDLIYKK